MKAKCKESQTATQVSTAAAPSSSGSGAGQANAAAVSENAKPVAVDSGREIDVYYRSKIQEVTAAGNVSKQIEGLKKLRREIDGLIENLIKSKKEIEVAEIGGIVSDIKVAPGKITADNIAINTTDKKMLIDVGTKKLSIEPTKTQVIINDGGLEVKSSGVSIKDNILTVGNSEVKLAPSEVARKLNITPKDVNLKEENSKAVYMIKVDEDRKLIWVIPVKIEKTLEADAGNGDILKESSPWWIFLTTE